ncbi:hypothetical protein SAMN05660485_03369 [Blastococcus fimeti]|nr:hypothetical protein SAMN05660485_03369 [Blastococcus fimeti]
MTDPLSVPIDKLRQALDRVLAALQADQGDVVPLSADYYWVLAPRATYDVYEAPSVDDFTIGQLSDDVVTLDEMLRPDQPVSIWHDLQHLAGILQRLATQDLPPGT